MLFADIVGCWTDLRATRSRKAKVARLSEVVARLAPEERPIGLSFLAGRLRQGKIGLGPAAVFGLEVPAAAADPSVTLGDVDTALTAIQQCSGKGSAAARKRLLGDVLGRATADEQTVLRSLIVGELRQGALDAVLTTALAEAADVPERALQRALTLSGDLVAVAEAALTGGETALGRFRIELFRPLDPMLAQTAAGVDDAVASGPIAAEWKLDGARIQLHRRGDAVRIFTRRLNDVTAALPEIVEAARRLPVDACVLDGEAIALRDDGRPHPFQTTMRRFGRRGDAAALRAELPLVPFYFDLLHLDGDDVVDRPAVDRHELLARVVPADQLPRRLVTDDAEALDGFFADALAHGHEGLMVKALDAPYEAGRRGAPWKKLKPAHTFDLVVLAVEWGSGRREGKLSNLHLGAVGDDGAPVMVGKTFKGLTDEVLDWQTRELLAREVRREGHVVVVRPELVVEVAIDGVQRSPQYPGGLALRFARVRRYRDDKTHTEADTLSTLKALLPTD